MTREEFFDQWIAAGRPATDEQPPDPSEDWGLLEAHQAYIASMGEAVRRGQRIRVEDSGGRRRKAVLE
jgi:hypothetical protein